MIVLGNIRAEAGVYRIISTITHRKYIGSSVDLRKRMQLHQSSFKGLAQNNKDLNLDCQAYGSDSFTFEIIVYCDSKEEALECEQYLLDYYDKNDQWDKLYNHSKDSRNPIGSQKGEKNFRWGKFGAENPSSKSVEAICVKTGLTTEFASATEAERQWSGVYQSGVSACCSGKLKKHFNHYWRYL